MISIVIPTLNEAANLAETMARAAGAAEVIVADGASSDGTQEIARKLGAVVIEAPKGRAAQMNAGAAAARGDVFVFLHADTWLESRALEAIQTSLMNATIVGGAFVRRFRSESHFLRFTCALARIRNRAIGWHLGDQAIFCRAEVFRRLGGFASLRAFEDVDFSRRLARAGRVVTLEPAVLSSARRFEKGAVARTLRDLGLTARYLLQPESFRV